MKKNWSTLRQSIDRLIYDATARSGQMSDDAARLFIERLFQRAIECRDEIAEELTKRRIKWLVHFTLAFNAPGILRHGLVPRGFLERKPLRDIISSVFPDDNRLDKMLFANCISVSFPNYQLFYAKRSQINKKWAVVLIEPDMVTKCPCLYFYHNAASGISGGRSIDSFQHMFYDQKINEPSAGLRSYLKLPDYYTTSPQAEILINSAIPAKFIRAVCVEDWETKKRIENACGKDCAKKVWVTGKYFSARHDFHFWTKKANNEKESGQVVNSD